MSIGQSSFRRILLSRLLLVSVPVLLMGVYVTYRKARSAFLETARQNLTESAVRKADNIDQSIQFLQVNLITAGESLVLKQVGDIFNLHPLLLEDVVNVPQRPKLEDYNNQLLVISQMVRLKEDESGFDTEQVSFVLGKRYLLSFQEEELQDCFGIVRDRIRTTQGRVRKSGAEYFCRRGLKSLVGPGVSANYSAVLPGLGAWRLATMAPKDPRLLTLDYRLLQTPDYRLQSTD